MDTQILDTILNTVSSACAGNGSISGYANSLFGYLIAIDFVLAILFNLLSFGGGQNFIGQTISKILCYGFWLWIIQNWGSLCNALINSLSIAGTSFGSLNPDVLKHPSMLIDMGIENSWPYWDAITKQTSWTSILSSLGVYLLALLGAIGIFLGFALIAFQVFVTYIEFYLSSALMLLFIPFGSNKYTERFAQNCIGGVIAHGVKLMFLGAIISLSGPILESLDTSFNSTPEWSKLATSAITPWAIAFLCWQAPSMAAGFMSGGPSLSASTLASNSMVAGGMGFSAGGSALSKGGTAAAVASMGGAGLTGAAVAGAKSVGENTAPMTGAIKGMGNFAKAGITSAASSAASPIMSSYKAGSRFGNFNK